MEPCVYLKSDLGEVLVLPEGQSVAGTSPDLSVPLEGPGIAGSHAAFHRQGAQAWITDLGSSDQGTFVNQGRIAAQQWAALRDGDIITFGGGPGFRIWWAPS